MRRVLFALCVLGCGGPSGPVEAPLPTAGYYCTDGTEAVHSIDVTLEIETEAGRAPLRDRVGSVCVRIGPGTAPIVTLHAVLNPPPTASPLLDEPQEIHCAGHLAASGVGRELDCRRYPEVLGTGDTHCLYDVTELRVLASGEDALVLRPVDARFRNGCSAWSTTAIHVGEARLVRVGE